jgi:hypothetical protein
VAATESAAAATMSSGEGIRRNRHHASQQSRSCHNTKISFHEYLQWSDRYVIVDQQISGRVARHHLNCRLEI